MERFQKDRLRSEQMRNYNDPQVPPQYVNMKKRADSYHYQMRNSNDPQVQAAYIKKQERAKFDKKRWVEDIEKMYAGGRKSRRSKKSKKSRKSRNSRSSRRY
jgi:hypothetical protein